MARAIVHGGTIAMLARACTSLACLQCFLHRERCLSAYAMAYCPMAKSARERERGSQVHLVGQV